MRNIFVLCAVLAICIALCCCSAKRYYPEEGIWYCGELNIQLDFQDGSNCFVVHNGKKIACAAGVDPGSSWISVGCQEADNDCFILGEEVFGAEFVSLDNGILVVQDTDSAKEYRFIRIG